jgi:hypothetical protein
MSLNRFGDFQEILYYYQSYWRSSSLNRMNLSDFIRLN